jgi:hypothetical protein
MSLARTPATTRLHRPRSFLLRDRAYFLSEVRVARSVPSAPIRSSCFTSPRPRLQIQPTALRCEGTRATLFHRLVVIRIEFTAHLEQGQH